MKEFIEKLIARLEEEAFDCTVAKDYVPQVVELDCIKEIVNQLVEEYKDNVIIDGQYCWQTCGATENCKECNRLCNGSIDYYENYDFMAEEHKGGWIPCSERLPSFDGAFICTAKGIEESLELIYSSFDNSWMDEFDSEYEVIAWQPLPPVFKPKGE